MEDLKCGDIICCGDMDSDEYAQTVVKVFKYSCHLRFTRKEYSNILVPALWKNSDVMQSHCLLYRKGDEDK